MAYIGAFEARVHFSSLLERVARGEEIVITRRGAPAAKLVPVAGASRERARAAIAGLKAFCEGQMLGGLAVRELREQGRR